MVRYFLKRVYPRVSKNGKMIMFHSCPKEWIHKTSFSVFRFHFEDVGKSKQHFYILLFFMTYFYSSIYQLNILEPLWANWVGYDFMVSSNDLKSWTPSDYLVSKTSPIFIFKNSTLKSGIKFRSSPTVSENWI